MSVIPQSPPAKTPKARSWLSIYAALFCLGYASSSFFALGFSIHETVSWVFDDIEFQQDMALAKDEDKPEKEMAALKKEHFRKARQSKRTLTYRWLWALMSLFFFVFHWRILRQGDAVEKVQAPSVSA